MVGCNVGTMNYLYLGVLDVWQMLCILCSLWKLEENLHNPGCCCAFTAAAHNALSPVLGTVDVRSVCIAIAVRQVWKWLGVAQGARVSWKDPSREPGPSEWSSSMLWVVKEMMPSVQGRMEQWKSILGHPQQQQLHMPLWMVWKTELPFWTWISVMKGEQVSFWIIFF